MTTKRSLTDVQTILTEEGLNPVIDGPKNTNLIGFCSLLNAKRDHLTWSKKDVYDGKELPACVVIAPSGSSLKGFPGAVAVVATVNPKAAFFSVLTQLWGKDKNSFIAPSAVVHGELEDDVSIGEHCFIGPEVHIGAGTRIENNVSICCPARIGNNCIIHSGAVIGSDGFGFYFEDGSPQKVEHYGGVIIGNRVEIGANTCIDRGTLDDTIISDDVKIDNLVHIAHNVVIEENAMVIAGAIVCGSARLGSGSYIAPGGIVKNQVSIGKDSLVGLGAVLTKDLGGGVVAVGLPAKPIRGVRPDDK